MSYAIYTILLVAGIIFLGLSSYIGYMYVTEYISEFLYKVELKTQRREEQERLDSVRRIVIDIITDIKGLDPKSVQISISSFVARSEYYVCIYEMSDGNIVFPSITTFSLNIDKLDLIQTSNKIKTELISNYIIPKQIKEFLEE